MGPAHVKIRDGVDILVHFLRVDMNEDVVGGGHARHVEAMGVQICGIRCPELIHRDVVGVIDVEQAIIQRHPQGLSWRDADRWARHITVPPSREDRRRRLDPHRLEIQRAVAGCALLRFR